MDDVVFLNYKVQEDLEELVEGCRPDVTETNTHYIIQCPFCLNELNYTQHKLYILKDYSTGHCFRCGSSFFNKNEFKLNTPLSNLKAIKFNVKDPDECKFKGVDSIDIDYYVNAHKILKDGVDYLNYRYSRSKYIKDVTKIDGVLQFHEPKYNLIDNIENLKIKFRNGKVIVPFYWNNKCIYYQIRFTDPNRVPKYFNPVIDNKPLYSCPFNKGSDIAILCEGVFGAIAISFMTNFEYDVYATLGSVITDYQLKLLDTMRYSGVAVYYDKYDISRSNYIKLIRNNRLRYEMTKIIKSPYGDPETDYLSGIVPKLNKDDFSRSVFSGFKLGRLN